MKTEDKAYIQYLLVQLKLYSRISRGTSLTFAVCIENPYFFVLCVQLYSSKVVSNSTVDQCISTSTCALRITDQYGCCFHLTGILTEQSVRHQREMYRVSGMKIYAGRDCSSARMYDVVDRVDLPSTAADSIEPRAARAPSSRVPVMAPETAPSPALMLYTT